MQSKKVRQRIIPTYCQTFHFTDPPLKVSPVCQSNCIQCNNCQNCINIIQHPITRKQTEQQKAHKIQLGISKQQKPHQYNIDSTPHEISFARKKQQLRGQLEQAGTAFFFKQKPYAYCKCKQKKLIAADCKFNHTCYGTIGPMNEYCYSPVKNYDRILKQKYDFKHVGTTSCEQGPIYLFKQKTKARKK